MALEGFSGIWGLNISNPPGTDDLSQADDHLRGIKQSLKNSFPLLSATSNMSFQAAYGIIYTVGSSTEFSASTSADLYTGFLGPGTCVNTTPRTASGAIICTLAGDYEAFTQFSISASTAANVTIAIYINNNDTGLHASTLVPAQGRSSVSIAGVIGGLAALDEVKTRISATTAKLITVKDAQLSVKKLS